MLRVEIISPERIVKSSRGVEVLLPTPEGQLGIRTGHVPLIVPLKSGEIVIKHTEKEEEVIAVHGGFVEVTGDLVRIMADNAELAEELDELAIQEAITRAKQIKAEAADALEIAAAQAIINSNIARIRALKRKSGNKHHQHIQQD